MQASTRPWRASLLGEATSTLRSQSDCKGPLSLSHGLSAGPQCRYAMKAHLRWSSQSLPG